jgi:hypothetical protein
VSLTTSGLISIGVARSLATAQNQLASAMFRLSTALPDAEEKSATSQDQVSLRISRYLGGLDEQLRNLSESLAIGQSAEAMIADVRVALDELSTLVTGALDPELEANARQTLQSQADEVRVRLDQRVAANALPLKDQSSSQTHTPAEGDEDSLVQDASLPAAVPRVDLSSPEASIHSAERLEEARTTLAMFEERISVILDRLEESTTHLRQVTESYSSEQSLERLKKIIDRDALQAAGVHDKANKEKVLLLLRPDRV